MSTSSALATPVTLKSNLSRAARTLPQGQRRVTWGRDEDGDHDAVIGSYDNAFILAVTGHRARLEGCQPVYGVLGEWTRGTVTGEAVVRLVAESLATA